MTLQWTFVAITVCKANEIENSSKRFRTLLPENETALEGGFNSISSPSIGNS
jgi:hypothetical protein